MLFGNSGESDHGQGRQSKRVMKTWPDEIRWRLARWIRTTAKKLDQWVSP